MKLENFQIKEKKLTERGAVMLGVQCLLSLEANQRKEENIMKRKSEISNKISSLNEEIKRLDTNLELINSDSSETQDSLDSIKTQYQISLVKLQEAKLALLERDLREKEKQLLLQKQVLSPEKPTLT